MHLFLLAQEGQTTPAPGQAPPGLMEMLAPMAIIFVIFWFLVIQPQRKAQKALKAKVAGLKKGDSVRTRGGLLGTVAKVEEDAITLRIDLDGKVRVRVARDAIENVMTTSNSKGAEAE